MAPLLVDHLDRILDVGERLWEARFAPRPITSAMDSADILAEHARLREFLEGLRALELTLAARVDKARGWARELRSRDGDLKLMASLFLSGTQPLADAMEELGDPRLQDFNGGDQALLFLKTRRLLPEHVQTLDEVREIAVGGAYAIAGRIELEPLVDLCVTFVEALDLHYGVLERPVSTGVEARIAHVH